MRHREMINGVAFPRAWIASPRERRDVPSHRNSHGKRDSRIVIFFIVDIIRSTFLHRYHHIISASESLRDGAWHTDHTLIIRRIGI